MDIVIVAQYLRNIEDFTDNNSRFVYLARLLEKDHRVEIITSDFIHGSKSHAEKVGELDNIKVTALHEPGYPKNVCLKRFSSHKRLAKNIHNYLATRKKPDVVYSAVPSLDVAEAAARYCKTNGVRFIVDIQDLWPEAFKMVFNIPVLCNLLFSPMEKKADNIYSAADEIIAVSETYGIRALRANKKCKSSLVAFLGTDLAMFDAMSTGSSIRKTKEEILIAYIGSLGTSYDISCVLNALKIVLENDKTLPVRLIIMGDGEHKVLLGKQAHTLNIPTTFTGKLPYSEMVANLFECDIAVNPIVHGSAGSIINKVGDYAMAGLPVINTQESEEYRALIEEYDAGINCECGNAQQVADAILTLCHNGSMRKKMGCGNRRMAQEKFDRKTAYQKICRVIENEGINC